MYKMDMNHIIVLHCIGNSCMTGIIPQPFVNKSVYKAHNHKNSVYIYSNEEQHRK